MRSVKELENYKLLTQNGQSLGRIKDVYFDDQSWRVQHIVVALDPRSFGHKQVLLEPGVLDLFRENGDTLLTRLTADQVQYLPAATSVLPVCKQYASLALASPGASRLGRGLAGADPHLRSARAVTHYRLTVNGEFGGTLSDLLLDPSATRVQYLSLEQIIDRRRIQFHIHPQAVERFSWAQQRIYLKYLQPVVLASDPLPVLNLNAA